MKRLILMLVLGTGVWMTACGGDSSGGPQLSPDIVPPDRPSNLQVGKIGDGEIQLTWAAPADSDWTFFVVYRAASAEPALAVDTTFQTQFDDRGLEYEVEYTYHVTAVDGAANESGPSNSVSGQPFNTLSPQAPTGLRAGARNIVIFDQLDILLDWNDNTEADFEFYRVYRAEEANFSDVVLRTAVAEPRFVDEEVEIGVRYFYRIAAVDRGGKESVPSESVSDAALAVTVLTEPLQGELTSPTPTFHWQAVPEALTYQVIVTTSPTSGEISAMPLTSDTSAVFQGRSLDSDVTVTLESGEIYYWKVIASTRSNGAENSVSIVESFKVR